MGRAIGFLILGLLAGKLIVSGANGAENNAAANSNQSIDEEFGNAQGNDAQANNSKGENSSSKGNGAKSTSNQGANNSQNFNLNNGGSANGANKAANDKNLESTNNEALEDKSGNVAAEFENGELQEKDSERPPANLVSDMEAHDEAPPVNAATGVEGAGNGNAPSAGDSNPQPVAGAAGQAGEGVTNAGAPTNDFSGAPPIPGTLKQIATGEGPEEYTVVKGDTLFDICDQLIDEPGYWPKLWSLNPQVKNPHFIYPGMVLKFYPGDEELPPYLKVVDEGDLVPVDKGNINQADLIRGEITGLERKLTIPPTPVVGIQDIVADAGDGMLDFGTVYSNDSIRIQVPGFIVEDKVDEIGTVIGGLDGERLSSLVSEVMIENESLQPGQTYSIVRYQGKVRSPEGNRFVGYRYDNIGVIKIDHMVDEGEIGIANVISARFAIEPDDLVVPYRSVSRVIQNNEARPTGGTSETYIIGTEYAKLSLAGAGSAVFLDRGGAGGISQGQFYDIYQQPGYLGDYDVRKKFPKDRRKVGVMQIIDVTPESSVGYIIYNSREIQVGDALFKGK